MNQSYEAYLLRITEPIQIPAVTFETMFRGRDKTIFVILEHQEGSCIVRGRDEFRRGFPKEVKRPDSGKTWYHSTGSRCLTLAQPYQLHAKYSSDPKLLAGNFLQDWGREIIDLLVKTGHTGNFFYDKGDIYEKNGSEGKGPQIIGLSGRIVNSEGVRLHRACWYEVDPISEIEPLLVRDKENPLEFRRRLSIANRGVFDYMVRRLNAQPIDIKEFVSDGSFQSANELQEYVGTKEPQSCV